MVSILQQKFVTGVRDVNFYSYEYFKSHVKLTNQFELIFILVLLAVAIFLVVQIIRKKISVQYKELALLLFILFSLMAGVKVSDAITAKNQQTRYQSNISSIDTLSVKLKVPQDQIFVSTPDITDQTVYKVRSDYYTLYWSDDKQSFIAVKLDVLVIDPINIINE